MRDCCTTENVGQGLALQLADSLAPNQLSVGGVAENLFSPSQCVLFWLVSLFASEIIGVHTEERSGVTPLPHQVMRL